MFVSGLIAAVSLLGPPQGATAQGFVRQIQAAAKTAKFESLRPLFIRPEDMAALEAMVERQQRLPLIGIAAIQCPAGFDHLGRYWVVFHQHQRLEHEHDLVYPIIFDGDGNAKLGSEIPEDIAVPWSVKTLDFDVTINPAEESAAFVTRTHLAPEQGALDIPFRINAAYRIESALFDGNPIPVVRDRSFEQTAPTQSPALDQSGSLLVLRNVRKAGVLELRYAVKLKVSGGDFVGSNGFLFTSYWYPHIGRKPSASRTKITGPPTWLLLGNGDLQSEEVSNGVKTVQYVNPVAISYHHIVGGPYVLAAEARDRGRTFRAWHLGTAERVRAEHDVQMAKDSVAFFEDRFGAFPYRGYDVVDTPDFYGVECYSFTVLTPRITSWATSHEVGHTYFGGLVPNTYIRSLWNESLTQYVDSIQFKRNSDKSLESGYASRKVPVALSAPMLAHGQFGNVGYMRGAFIFKMLENEVGLDSMNAALRSFIESRKGQASEWHHIEHAFERSTGKELSWFFDQWVRGSTFPIVGLDAVWVEQGPQEGYTTSMRLTQSGARTPFRLKYEVVLTDADGEHRFVVDHSDVTCQPDFKTRFRPMKARFDALGWTLADLPNARDI